MASLDDLFSAAKNIAVALSNASQTYLSVQGQITQNAMTADTLVKDSGGRVVVVSVIVAGAAGSIHDAQSIALATSANKIAVIPATVGPFTLNMPFRNGLVVSPGAGQTVSVSYS